GEQEEDDDGETRALQICGRGEQVDGEQEYGGGGRDEQVDGKQEDGGGRRSGSQEDGGSGRGEQENGGDGGRARAGGAVEEMWTGGRQRRV
ncbi:unnamed protein product, partial [Urochloa humidicola]